MIFARGLCCVLLIVFACWSESDAAGTTVVGIANKSITLTCDIPHSEPPVVSWVDRVYNAGHDFKPIFSSDAGMNSNHSNRDNFSVNPDDFSLTIHNLRLELGAGKYICRSTTADGTVTERVYNLVVRGMPHCRGDSQLVSGESTRMICEVRLAGTFKPALRWTRDGAVVPSRDDSAIGTAMLLIDVDSVGSEDDKAEYHCEMTMGDVVEDGCSIRLDVAYGATDVKFSTEKKSLSVGEELRCSARGNPVPAITLGPADVAKETRSGDGWRSVVVQSDWVGRTLTVECTATNNVDGEEFSRSDSVTFNVTEKASKQESSSNNSTAIIAVVVIVVLIAAAAVIAICIILRRRSKKPPKGSKPIPTKEDSTLEHRGTNGQTTTA